MAFTIEGKISHPEKLFFYVPNGIANKKYKFVWSEDVGLEGDKSVIEWLTLALTQQLFSQGGIANIFPVGYGFPNGGLANWAQDGIIVHCLLSALFGSTAKETGNLPELPCMDGLIY